MDEQQPPPVPSPGWGGIGTTVERGLALVLVAAVVLGVLATLQPFATAILFGSILAIALWPLRVMLVERGFRRGRAASLLLLQVIAAIILPLLAVAPGLVAAIEGGRALRAPWLPLHLPRRPPGWSNCP